MVFCLVQRPCCVTATGVKRRRHRNGEEAGAGGGSSGRHLVRCRRRRSQQGAAPLISVHDRHSAPVPLLPLPPLRAIPHVSVLMRALLLCGRWHQGQRTRASLW